MSDLVRVFGLPEVIEQRLHTLQDLSQFGIHVNNPRGQCCVCGAATAGFTEGITADDLCRQCGWGVQPDRWTGQFYTNETLLVSNPFVYQSNVRVIWDGQDLSGGAIVQQLGIVLIDGRLYLLRESYSSSTSALIDPTTMVVVREAALYVGRNLLEELYRTQQPL